MATAKYKDLKTIWWKLNTDKISSELDANIFSLQRLKVFDVASLDGPRKTFYT